MKLFRYTFILILVLSTVQVAYAQDEESDGEYNLLETLPFAGAEGSVVNLPDYIEGIFNLGIAIVGIAALLMISIGGFWYVTSAGNSAQVERAKSIIGDALLGLFVALFAWLILNVINPNLTQYRFGGFDVEVGIGQNECAVGGVQENCGVGSGRGSSGNTVQDCDDCVSTEDQGYEVKPASQGCAAAECMINSDLNDSLNALAQTNADESVPFRVNETWPPTDDHQNACHFDGTCTDVSISNPDDRTPENIRFLMDQGDRYDMNWVYEVGTQERLNELIAPPSTLTVNDVILVSGVEEHYSVYPK